MDFVRATSLNNLGMGKNYQLDYSGLAGNTLTGFEQWCTRNDASWAHVFDEKTGAMIATYSRKDGVKVLIPV